MITTPSQVYMQNLSQICEPACPQIFDLAPFLRSIALKGATSRYFEFILGSLKIVVIVRNPLCNSLLGYTNTKEVKINQKGTWMVKNGELEKFRLNFSRFTNHEIYSKHELCLFRRGGGGLLRP